MKLLLLFYMIYLTKLVMGLGPSKTFSLKSQDILKKKVINNGNNISKETATFAGGCFWGIELAFQRVPGVISTQVGYTQGQKENPTYEEVCRGTTGHTEAVQLEYDTNTIKYSELLTVFWDLIDPTVMNRQGNDVGTQYRAGIYYHNDNQKNDAMKSRDELAKLPKYLNKKIVTEILPATKFWSAEKYHQQYLEKGGQCARTGDLSPIRCYG